MDLFFPNEQEARAIAQTAAVHGTLAALAARVPIVAVKRGEQGVLVAGGHERLAVPVEPAPQVVDTVGAGDSFDARFLAA